MEAETIRLGLSLGIWLTITFLISVRSPALGMILAVPVFAASAIFANWAMTHIAQVAVAFGISAAVVAFIAAYITAERSETVSQAVAGYNSGDNKRRDFLMKDGNVVTTQYWSGDINPDQVASASFNPAEEWRW